MTARIIGLVLVGAAAFAACGGDDAAPPEDTPPAPPPTATPVPTATAAATTALDESFRAFAAEIDAATRAGDVAFFMERLKTEPVVCTEELVKDRYGGPACTIAGERFDGFAIGKWRSSGAVVPVASVEKILRGSYFETADPLTRDEFGNGGPRLYAINAAKGDCAAVLTAIVRTGSESSSMMRVAILTSWEGSVGHWRMTKWVVASGGAVDLLRPDDVVRSYYPRWERYAPP